MCVFLSETYLPDTNTKKLLPALFVCLLMLTITTGDGQLQEYLIREDGTITRMDPYGEMLIYQKQNRKP